MTWPVVSRRKAPDSAAACLGVRGGQSRVFERPARGALAMTPMAQRGSIGRRGPVTRQIPANQLKPSRSQ